MQKKLPPIGIHAPCPEGINIIREDYLLPQQTIFATARAKRPEQYKKPEEQQTGKENCPFCPENQDKIILIAEEKISKENVSLQSIAKQKTEIDWQFRCVENLFGILKPKGNISSCPLHDELELHTQTDAYGFSEVVIETPDHEKELEDLPQGTIANLLSFLGKRVHDLEARNGVRFVSVFKNRGRLAGASISHSHTQIITTPCEPFEISQLRAAHNRYERRHDESPFVKIIASERESKRFIAENEHAICFAPFASKAPMEVMIIPKRLVQSLSFLGVEERHALEDLLLPILLRLKELGTPPYNLLFMNDNSYGDLPLHLILRPRISTPPAGFEFETGLVVNPTLPEDAAKFYRGEE